MNFSSRLIEDAVNAFSSLPGIGKKTALRLALHLMKQSPDQTESFTSALLNMRRNIKSCERCFNLSDEATCKICNNQSRNQTVICLVENIRDVMAIEDTGQFRGVYHVLGGVISPIEGVGPEQLKIQELLDRVEKEDIKEVIMAISPTIEGDTTIFYISKRLKGTNVKVSTIARGVSFGGELEYADELTLARSIQARIPYQHKAE